MSMKESLVELVEESLMEESLEPVGERRAWLRRQAGGRELG